MIRRGLGFVGVGVLLVVSAVLVSYTFDALLPDDARFWGTLALSAIALGFFLLGGGTLAAARSERRDAEAQEPSAP